MNINKSMLRGIIPPMVTPLLDTNTLDEQVVENLVEHLIKGGVSGIFILGTTGEAQHLSFKIKEELIRKTAACIGGRVMLLVGITDTSIIESLRIARIAAENNATAVVATPPYFFALGQPEPVDYFDALATQSPLPLFLYNMPVHTKTMIEIDTVLTLSQHQNIIGVKDSSASGVYLHKMFHLFKDRPDFRLFVGPEEMMASMVMMGAHGGISGGANYFPDIYVKLFQAASEKDVQKVLELQPLMMSVSLELFGIGRFAAGYIKGIKTALSLKGICSDVMSQPFNHFLEPQKEQVKKAVEKLDQIFA